MSTVNTPQVFFVEQKTKPSVNQKNAKVVEPTYKKFIDYKAYQKNNMDGLKDTFYSKKDPAYEEVQQKLQQNKMMEALSDFFPSLKDKMSQDKKKLMAEKNAITSKYKPEFKNLMSTEDGR